MESTIQCNPYLIYGGSPHSHSAQLESLQELTAITICRTVGETDGGQITGVMKGAWCSTMWVLSWMSLDRQRQAEVRPWTPCWGEGCVVGSPVLDVALRGEVGPRSLTLGIALPLWPEHPTAVPWGWAAQESHHGQLQPPPLPGTAGWGSLSCWLCSFLKIGEVKQLHAVKTGISLVSEKDLP